MNLNLKKLLLTTAFAFSSLMASDRPLMPFQPSKNIQSTKLRIMFIQQRPSPGNTKRFHYCYDDYNIFSSQDPHQKAICNILNPDTINHSGKKLFGRIPENIFLLTTLQTLDLSKNSFSGTIPATICILTNLRTLNLFANQITGTIPAAICNLTNLQTLDLSANQITGTIPAAICNLTNLQTLNLFANQITGTIPAAICNLTNLQTLNLCGNRITGEIPTAICNLTKLQMLDLSANQITGAIPIYIGNLRELQSLHLFGNNLMSTIPQEIWEIPTLKTVQLHPNALVGRAISGPEKLINTFFHVSTQADGSCAVRISSDELLFFFGLNEVWLRKPQNIIQFEQLLSSFANIGVARQWIMLNELMAYAQNQKLIFHFPNDLGTITIFPKENDKREVHWDEKNLMIKKLVDNLKKKLLV